MNRNLLVLIVAIFLVTSVANALVLQGPLEINTTQANSASYSITNDSSERDSVVLLVFCPKELACKLSKERFELAPSEQKDFELSVNSEALEEASYRITLVALGKKDVIERELSVYSGALGQISESQTANIPTSKATARISMLDSILIIVAIVLFAILIIKTKGSNRGVKNV